MMMARVMLAASSNCCMHTLTTADPSNKRIRGFLNCSRYFFHTGSSSLATSSL